MGATVTLLPDDAVEKKVGDSTYHVYENTWYKAFIGGEDVVYMVVAEPKGATASL